MQGVASREQAMGLTAKAADLPERSKSIEARENK